MAESSCPVPAVVALDTPMSVFFTVAVVLPAAPFTISWIGDLSLVASTAAIRQTPGDVYAVRVQSVCAIL